MEKDHVEERSGEKIERQDLLFKQINRINESHSLGLSNFIAAVENLEINLVPEINKSTKTEENLKKLDEWYKKTLEKSKQNKDHYVSSDTINSILFEFSKAKFKILMLLMDEKSMLPIKHADYYDLDS